MIQERNGSPAYVMRLLKALHCKKRLRATTNVETIKSEFRRLLQTFFQICQTIAYAHSRGVIHRDLKTDNVMLVVSAKLSWSTGVGKSGWAICRRAPAGTPCEETLVPQSGGMGGETKLGSAIGTPAYMSPEQAAGRWDVIDHRTDVYGLGAVLYTILSGKRPIESDNWPETQQLIQQGRYKRPREEKNAIPRSLEAICLRAMALRPEDRYTSAGSLAQDIERWLADEPVAAYEESISEKLKRWVNATP